MLRLLFLVILFAAKLGVADDSLPLEGYLSQVTEGNLEVRSARQQMEGSKQRTKEADMMVSLNLFAEAQAISDAKLPQVNLYTYDKILNQNYSLGLKKTTTWGQDIKLYYAVSHLEFANLTFAGAVGGAPGINYYDARPVLELTQNLWSNGFGKRTRADMAQIENQQLANSYNSSYQLRSAVVQAEQAYWKLALARDLVEVQKNALQQSRKIYEWADGRAKRHLADEADALQAKAALEVRELEMQSAIDAEREASRAFNRLRGKDSDVVAERLADLEIEKLLTTAPAARAEKRDDVKAAEAQQRAAVAGAVVVDEKNQPVLDAYGSVALNGRDNAFTSSLSNSYTANRPTYSVGVRLSVPLDRSAASDLKEGLQKQQQAAQLLYEHKLRDQEQEWQDLTRKLVESKKRLTLSRQISEAQKRKLVYERERLKLGRTTTYQVLLFEQDSAQAELSLIRAETELVSLLAQTKLFGGSL